MAPVGPVCQVDLAPSLLAPWLADAPLSKASTCVPCPQAAFPLAVATGLRSCQVGTSRYPGPSTAQLLPSNLAHEHPFFSLPRPGQSRYLGRYLHTLVPAQKVRSRWMLCYQDGQTGTAEPGPSSPTRPDLVFSVLCEVARFQHPLGLFCGTASRFPALRVCRTELASSPQERAAGARPWRVFSRGGAEIVCICRSAVGCRDGGLAHKAVARPAASRDATLPALTGSQCDISPVRGSVRP